MDNLKSVIRATAALALIVLSTAVFATPPQPTPLNWDQLPDSNAQVYEDPFTDLTSEQINALSDIVRASDTLKKTDVTLEDRAKFEQKKAQAKAKLANEGIDSDWMISQRWVVADLRTKAASAGNAALDDSLVTIGGFAIPAPPDANGTRFAYLVPVPGMCSHMPPPDPNQLIRLRLFGDWSPARMHEPVKITGRLQIAPTKQTFRVIDGPVPMVATWQLDVDQVVSYSDFSARQPATNRWVDQLRDNLGSRLVNKPAN
ncbi:MAG: DUF3299 domain-containing protein [Rhizobiaceae bacterium]